MIALLAAALAADPSYDRPMTGLAADAAPARVAYDRPMTATPVLPSDVPEPVAVQVDGEAWIALHPDLYRWRLARSVYADQIEADRDRLRALVEANALDYDACRIRLSTEQDVSAAWERRVAEWESYADRVERRERRQGVRDVALVLGGAAVVVGGAWIASLAP